MRHSAFWRLAFAPSLALCACSSSYHPEYHPVTVSNFSQNIAYPVAVHTGGGAAAPSPVLVMPGPQAGVVMPVPAGPPEPPPADFFH